MSNILIQSKRKFHTVYKITNLINKMIYVGAHSTDLINDTYYGSGFRLTLAIKKYGKENFKKEILHVFDSPIDMFNKEKEIVNIEFLKRNDVYNIVEGGFGGFNKGTLGLKHLYHPILKTSCAVHPSVIDNMLLEGWTLGRDKSSTSGTIWIYKENEQKMILPSLLDRYINEGWLKGKPKSPTAGMIWIYNQSLNEYSLCEKTMLEQRLSQGWIKKKWTPVKKGNCWVNNLQENLRIPKEELEKYLSDGWIKGMITARWN